MVMADPVLSCPYSKQSIRWHNLGIVAKLDRLERLTDLMLVLLETKRPLTISEISHMVAGYPEGEEACRLAFERDKRTLREEGIPISVEPVAAREQLGYRIHADQYYLSSLQLSLEEQVALNLAVAGVHLDDSTATAALSKIGVDSLPGAGLIATMSALPVLSDLFDALRSKKPITFTYKGIQRELVVEGLVFKRGHWYLAGWDRSRSAFRIFRADRLEGGITVVEPKGGSGATKLSPPDDLESTTSQVTQGENHLIELLDLEPWKAGDEELLMAKVVVDSSAASWVRGELASGVVVVELSDGSIQLELEVTNRAAFRAWLFGLLSHAVVVEPPSLVDFIVDWLKKMLHEGSAEEAIQATSRVSSSSMGSNPEDQLPSKSSRSPSSSSSSSPPSSSSSPSSPSSPSSSPPSSSSSPSSPSFSPSSFGGQLERGQLEGGQLEGGQLEGGQLEGGQLEEPSGISKLSPLSSARDKHDALTRRPQRMKAGERLRRLLAILSYLARRKEASIDELSQRFDMDSHELVQELELAACCGLPPYTPDQLIDLLVEEDRVIARLGEGFARQRRLNSKEALALIASARAILAIPGADPDGALASALTKLEQAVGLDGELQVDLDEPMYLDSVRKAAHGGEKLQIEYYSASRDELRWREIVPLMVVAINGHWYCDAFCEYADALRRFRIDRIAQMRSLGAVNEQTLDAYRQRYNLDTSKSDQAFLMADDDVVVTLDIGKEGRWIVEAYPVLGVEDLGNERLIVSLPVGGRAFLERLLLRLGPDAKVLAPRDLVNAGAVAAERLLRNYGEQR